MKREDSPNPDDVLMRMDEVLRRMLNTPPKPRKRAKKKAKKPAK